MISRNAKILAAAGAAVVLTGGAVGAAQLDKSVNLSVDGTASTAHVFGSTVADVLDSQGISVKPGDVVVPAVDSSISDGQTIIVKYTRLLTITIDGKTRQLRTTETTVDGALLALGLRGRRCPPLGLAFADHRSPGSDPDRRHPQGRDGHRRRQDDDEDHRRRERR